MSRLPILMYHNVSKNQNDSKGLTISTSILEEQFEFLNKSGYKTFHFSELQDFNLSNPLPDKSIIITFDDVYVNQKELAYPLLKKHNLKASFFIPFKFVDGVDSWNVGSEKIMSTQQLKSLDESIIELGLHSFSHLNYNEMSIEDIDADFEKCKNFIKRHRLPVNNVLAYPFGKYPKKNPNNRNFLKCFTSIKWDTDYVLVIESINFLLNILTKYNVLILKERTP